MPAVFLSVDLKSADSISRYKMPCRHNQKLLPLHFVLVSLGSCLLQSVPTQTGLLIHASSIDDCLGSCPCKWGEEYKEAWERYHVTAPLFLVQSFYHDWHILIYRTVIVAPQKDLLILIRFLPIELSWATKVEDSLHVVIILLRDEISYC